MKAADRLRKAGNSYGFWCATAHPGVLDTAASLGPDFICIDTQHGTPLSALDISTFTALAHYDIPSLVRVEALDEENIGRALDLGADGVVIPMVETSEDAERAVAACRYGPAGVRSFGIQTRRVTPLDDEAPICWIQIETAGAMEELEEIAGLEGVDGLYVGPADLGLALIGQPAADVLAVFDGSHPQAEAMMRAFDRVVTACRESGKAAGLHCGSGEAAAQAASHGFTLAAVAADLGLIERGLGAELATARSS